MVSSFLLVAWSLVPLASHPAIGPITSPTSGSTELVAKLGSKDFHEREAATRALAIMGQPALPELRLALASKDPEVQRRASSLVEAIERREETARLLAPRTVRIHAVDKPLSAVAADLSRDSGFTVLIDESVREQIGDRRITLDTGETTFWQALDALCREAGLADSNSPVPNFRANARDKSHRLQILIEQRQAMYLGGQGGDGAHFYLSPARKDAFSEVKRSPVSFAGALRCRIGAEPGGKIRVVNDQIYLPMEVAGQPDVLWEQLLDFKLDHAIDDQGQELQQASILTDPREMQINRAIMGLGNGMVLNRAGGLDLIPDQTGILRLKAGEHRSRKLVKLSGAVVGQMRTPVQSLLVVDNIRKQAGKTFRTGYGECLDVLAVAEQEGGVTRLEIRLREPPSMVSVPGNGRIAVRGNLLLKGQPVLFNRFGARTDAVLQADLRLKDADGRAIRLGSNVRYAINLSGDMLATTATILIRRPQNASPIASLEWFGQHSTIVEVPFHFTNIDLP
jgi:hypothetical protein